MIANETDIGSVSVSRRREREGGAALILSFLVLMVLVVVIGQITVSSSVDRSIALNTLRDLKFDYAGIGAMEVAKSNLLRDAKDEAAQEAPPGGEGGGSGLPGAGGGSDVGVFGGGDEEVGEGADDKPSDSLLDIWADEAESSQQFGEGVEVRIRIVDEDRKLNILALASTDDEFREQFQDRLIRLIDTFREESRHDVSRGTAVDIAEQIELWLKGERDHDIPIPRMSTDAQDDSSRKFSAEVFDKDAPDRVVFPISIDELLHLDDVDEFLLRGFMEDDVYVPGLEDVLTVYSNLVFDETRFEADDEEEDSPFQTPFGSDRDAEEDDDESSEEEAPTTDDEGALVATETNQGRVNINTVPFAVLRSLVIDDEIPLSVIERIDEFRRNAWNDDVIGRAKAFASKFTDEGSDEEARDETDDEFGSSPEDFTFSDPEQVIERTEKYFNVEFDLTPEQQKMLVDLITTKSHIFSIYLEMRSTAKGGGTPGRDHSDWTPPERIYRAVVWRRTGDKPECITLVPLHRWAGVVPPDSEDYRKEFPFRF